MLEIYSLMFSNYWLKMNTMKCSTYGRSENHFILYSLYFVYFLFYFVFYILHFTFIHSVFTYVMYQCKRMYFPLIREFSLIMYIIIR